MHTATTADSGIYHCLITFYKWICGYLPRGSVTLVLCVKSYVFSAGTAAAGCQNVCLLCSSFLFRRGKTAEGIIGRQGEALLEYLWWIPERELTLRLFFPSHFFRYLMHKYCNSDYYLSPLQRCLSLLSRTASSLLVSDIELKCKALLLPARCSKWSFALHKGSSEVQYSRPDTLPRGAVGYSVGFSYIYSVNLTDVCEDRVHHGNDNNLIIWQNRVFKMHKITNNTESKDRRQAISNFKL